MSTGSTIRPTRSPSHHRNKESQQDKMEKSGGQAGRVPITGILVNQGSRKVKLEGEEFTEEELCHVSIKLENEWRVNANDGTTNEEDHEDTFGVTKVEVDPILLAPAEDSADQGQRSSCSCQEEIKSLKFTVKQLIQQMEQHTEMIKKQSQMISGIKSSIRNAALSLLTCGKDEDGNGVPEEFPENEETARLTAVTPQPQLLSHPEVTASHKRSETQTQDNFQDGEDCTSPVTIVSCTGNYSDGVQKISIPSLASPQVSYNVGPKTNEDEETGEMNEVNYQEDDDKDSLYVPDDDSEEEADQEMEDENYSNRASSSGAKSKRVHPKTVSTFKCHLCTKVFKERHSLKKHIQSAHEGIRYKCTHCPYRCVI